MTTNRTQGSLYTRVENQVATIEFGHPASNSFTSELLDRLARELHELAGKQDVAVILLRSEGEKAFCAGASFDELVAIEDLDSGKAFFSGFAKVINAMRRCPQPIIGRVHGKAVGGGVGLIAACDYVFATETAAIRLSEITIGIAPLVIAPAVERKAGTSGLAELSLAPTQWKSAYWAQDHGLYAKVFENAGEMDKALDSYTAQLGAYNPEALAMLKKALWTNTDHWDELLDERAAASGSLALSPATKKALAKFKK